jgi:hypothetical protein
MYNPEDVELNRRAENIIRNEVLCCDSHLVDTLLKLETPVDGFTWDEVEMPRTETEDWSIEECKDYLSDNGYSGDLPEDPEDEWEWRGCAQSVADANDEAVEIFEWWRVTESLCEDLRELGEPVLDNDYGHWWGRTTTGQGIIGDGIIQEVVKLIEARTASK